MRRLTNLFGTETARPTNKTLRLAVLGLASVETLYWLYIVVVASKRANNPAADAMQTMPAILATPPFLLLTLPALVLSLADRWLILAAVLAGLGAIFLPFDAWTHLFD
jgi:hypothetical protein